MKAGVVIGRFQGVHQGHIHLIKEAMYYSDIVYILIGSSNRSPSIENPFSFQKRVEDILFFLSGHGLDGSNICFLPLNDYYYDDTEWCNQVDNILSGLETMGLTPTIFGHKKEGNFYLDWFPCTKYQEVEDIFNGEYSGIKVRELLFNNLDKSVVHIQDDWDFSLKEKELFKDYPFKDTLNFNCADFILECEDHILLIRRKNSPGKGQLALPGGFKNSNESFVECAIREFKEETGIDIEEDSKYTHVNSKLYDKRPKTQFIPRNTMAVHYRYEGNRGNIVVNVGDDASDFLWVSRKDIEKGDVQLFSDHQDIVQDMLGWRTKHTIERVC